MVIRTPYSFPIFGCFSRSYAYRSILNYKRCVYSARFSHSISWATISGAVRTTFCWCVYLTGVRYKMRCCDRFSIHLFSVKPINILLTCQLLVALRVHGVRWPCFEMHPVVFYVFFLLRAPLLFELVGNSRMVRLRYCKNDII